MKFRCGLDETAETLSRSPHGERGLKSEGLDTGKCTVLVALLMESVD